MALEIRQNLKLTQTLIMTQKPQPAQNGPTLVHTPGRASPAVPSQGMDRRVARRRWTPMRAS